MPVNTRSAAATRSTPNTPSSSSALQHGVLGAVVIIIATFLAYAPAIQSGFIWDDDVLLTNNPLVKASDGLFSFWFTRKPIDYWPLTMSSFWLEWRLWGMNPMGYHVTNVLLHALGAVCLWGVLKKLKLPGPWWIALIFALHPVNVQSTAWISERKNTLSMIFYMLSVLFFLRSEQEPSPAPSTRTASIRFYLLSLGTFALALCGKTSGVLMPLVLLGSAWWLNGRVGWRNIVRVVPFLALSLGMSVATIWFQYNRSIGQVSLHETSFLERLAGAGWAFWFYLYKALLPINLSFVYPHWKIDANSVLSYLPTGAVVALFLVLWWKRQSWGRPLLFALGYYLLMLLPILGFFKVFFFRYSLVADHYQYLPIIGVIALVVGTIVHFRKPQAVAILLVLAFILGITSNRQCTIYRNQDTLWAHTLKRDPNSWMAHANWGYYCAGTGRGEEAMQHYDAALALKPDEAGTLFNKGAALLEKGHIAEAVQLFRECLRVQPDNVECLSGLAWVLAINRDPAIHNRPEAVRYARRAVELTRGEDALKLDTLAACEAAADQFKNAVATQTKAISIARTTASTEELAGMEKRLQLYRSGRPFLEGD